MANTEGLLSHDVYFTLIDKSPEARQKIVDAAQKYLAPHPKIVFFGCGVLAEELKRDVNDHSFDVALHIVFTDQAAHDSYQESDDHNQFIAENKSNWKQVRVFDSLVTQSPATA